MVLDWSMGVEELVVAVWGGGGGGGGGELAVFEGKVLSFMGLLVLEV